MNSRKRKFTPKVRCDLPFHMYLTYLLMGTFLLAGVSFSCYVSNANADESACVAKGEVMVSYDPDSTSVELEQPEGQEYINENDFLFRVSNGDSEVNIRYDLLIQLDETLPDGVTIELYKNGQTEPAAIFDETEETEFMVWDAGAFQAGNQATDQYRMIVRGDFETVKESCDRELSISVQAEQIGERRTGG